MQKRDEKSVQAQIVKLRRLHHDFGVLADAVWECADAHVRRSKERFVLTPDRFIEFEEKLAKLRSYTLQSLFPELNKILAHIDSKEKAKIHSFVHEVDTALNHIRALLKGKSEVVAEDSLSKQLYRNMDLIHRHERDLSDVLHDEKTLLSVREKEHPEVSRHVQGLRKLMHDFHHLNHLAQHLVHDCLRLCRPDWKEKKAVSVLPDDMQKFTMSFNALAHFLKKDFLPYLKKLEPHVSDHVGLDRFLQETSIELTRIEELLQEEESVTKTKGHGPGLSRHLYHLFRSIADFHVSMESWASEAYGHNVSSAATASDEYVGSRRVASGTGRMSLVVVAVAFLFFAGLFFFRDMSGSLSFLLLACAFGVFLWLWATRQTQQVPV